MSSFRAIVSGGGTGGHIFPALAIANALREARPDAEILFVGASGKMEMEKVPEAGYKIIGLPIRGLQRKLTLSNLKVPFLLISSLLKSRKTIKNFKPDVVIGVGGYASAAVVYTASFMGIRTVVQEQNSYPGVTNKILSSKANLICTAFEGMERFFPKEKIRLLGNPIRQEILADGNKKNEGISHFRLDPGRKTILLIGGSLGARTINQCAQELIPLIDSHGIQILWQCGKSSYDMLKDKIEKQNNQHLHLHQFISKMGLAYACADLVISRAGALSVSEIAALRKIAVLIPSPNVAEDHQTKNARALSEKNAAILLKDTEAPGMILDTTKELLDSESKSAEIAKALSAVFSSEHAAKNIAAEILKLAEVQ